MQINSKNLTIIALFSAISIVLSLSPLKFSAPFATFLKYQVWEIAIVTAFLLYGLKVGSTISVINTIVLFLFFPGDLPSGPFYNLIAVLGTLLGVFIIQKTLIKRFCKRREVILIILSTFSAIILRVLVMSIVNFIVLPLDFPFGYNVPQELLPSFLSVTALFNATIVLYTIPVAYMIARTVSMSVKTKIWE